MLCYQEHLDFHVKKICSLIINYVLYDQHTAKVTHMKPNQAKSYYTIKKVNILALYAIERGSSLVTSSYSYVTST